MIVFFFFNGECDSRDRFVTFTFGGGVSRRYRLARNHPEQRQIRSRLLLLMRS